MNTMRLKHIARVIAGQSPAGDTVLEEGTIPFLQGCAEFGERHPIAKHYCEMPAKLAPEGSWLMSVRAPVGELNFADRQYGIGRGLAAIVPTKSNSRFLGYALLHARDEFGRVSTGSTYDAVSASQIGNLIVPLPDRQTQRDIADFLDREIARIDQLIEEKRRLVELLKEKEKSQNAWLVVRGLDPSSELAATGVEWIPEAPSHWRIRRIATLFRESKEMGEEGLPVLSVSINWGISDRELGDEDRHRIVNQIEDKTAYKRVRPGDLVYNMMRAWQGAFGVATIDGLVSPAYVVARPNEEIHSLYFEPLLRTSMCIEEFRRASKGIADFRQRLYWEHFRQVRVVLPPLEEQRCIAQKVGEVSKTIARVLEPIEASIERLSEYRAALITAAVTGQIDVRTWGKRGETDRRLDRIEEDMAALRSSEKVEARA